MARASSFVSFLDHTQRRTTVGRTTLDEWSARRRDLYLTTHNTHNRQTSMPPVGFEPAIPASEWPQTYALDRAATGTCGSFFNYQNVNRLLHRHSQSVTHSRIFWLGQSWSVCPFYSHQFIAFNLFLHKPFSLGIKIWITLTVICRIILRPYKKLIQRENVSDSATCNSHEEHCSFSNYFK